MGNCVETCRQEDPGYRSEATKVLEKGPTVLGGKDGRGGGGVRTKVVLTKEELGWLLLRLSATRSTQLGGSGVLGKDKLKELLGEIESARRERRRSDAEVSWKPSLESITEAPEIHEMGRR